MDVTKTEGGSEFKSSAYLVVPDPKTPSTWKLRVEESPGTVTVPQLGRAAAALGKGFRGNKVELSDEERSSAMSKLRAAYGRLGVAKGDLPPVLQEQTVMSDGSLSYEALVAACQDALEDQWEEDHPAGGAGMPMSYCSQRVDATFDDHFVYHDEEGSLWRQGYRMDGTEAALDGEPTRVVFDVRDAPSSAGAGDEMMDEGRRLQEGRFSAKLAARGFSPRGDASNGTQSYAHGDGHEATVHTDAKGRERALSVRSKTGQARFMHAGDSSGRVDKILSRITGKKSIAATEAALAEGTTLTEWAPAGVLGRSKLNREANIIEGTVLIGPMSSNGPNKQRRYSERALKQIAAMAEGLPAYANHVAPEMAFKPRDVRDLIGKHQNIRYDPTTGKVMSDLHLLEHQAPWVFSVAEKLGDRVGNSLVSRALTRMEGQVEVVEEMQTLRSGDLVSDPATTRGLFEADGAGDEDGRAAPGVDFGAYQALTEAGAAPADVRVLAFSRSDWATPQLARDWARRNGFDAAALAEERQQYRIGQAPGRGSEARRTVRLSPAGAPRVDAVVGVLPGGQQARRSTTTLKEARTSMDFTVDGVTQYLKDNTGEQKVIAEALGFVPKGEVTKLQESLQTVTTERDQIKSDHTKVSADLAKLTEKDVLATKRAKLSEAIGGHEIGKRFPKSVTPGFRTLLESVEETEWKGHLDDMLTALKGVPQAGQSPVSDLSEARREVADLGEGDGAEGTAKIDGALLQRAAAALTR